MSGPRSLEHQEKLTEQEPSSRLEGVLNHGKALTAQMEQQNEHVTVDIESLPLDIDKASFKEKLGKLQNIQTKMKQAVLAASFLALVHGQALAESTPKDQDVAPQTQEYVEATPTPSVTMQETNVTLQIIKGVAEAMLEQKKRDGKEILDGVDSEGKKVEIRERIGKASEMIPRQIPKLGNIAFVISTVLDIQKEVSEAKPGYEKNIAVRVIKLLADIPTHGLASFAWDFLSKREESKKNGTLTYRNQSEQQAEQLVPTKQQELQGEGSDEDKFDPEQAVTTSQESTSRGL